MNNNFPNTPPPRYESDEENDQTIMNRPEIGIIPPIHPATSHQISETDTFMASENGRRSTSLNKNAFIITLFIFLFIFLCIVIFLLGISIHTNSGFQTIFNMYHLKCYCENGTPEANTQCLGFFKNSSCATCNEGYSYGYDRDCVPTDCSCRNGYAPVVNEWPMNSSDLLLANEMGGLLENFNLAILMKLKYRVKYCSDKHSDYSSESCYWCKPGFYLSTFDLGQENEPLIWNRGYWEGDINNNKRKNINFKLKSNFYNNHDNSKDMDYFQQQSFQYYDLKEYYKCYERICYCKNGIPERGENCPAHGGKMCKSCYPDYALKPNKNGNRIEDKPVMECHRDLEAIFDRKFPVDDFFSDFRYRNIPAIEEVETSVEEQETSGV